MAKLKMGFTVKVEGLLDLEEYQVEKYKESQAKGGVIPLSDAVKQEVAEAFGLPVEDVEVLEAYEELIEDTVEGEGA